MPSQQSLVNARSIALQNATESEHLPQLSAGYKFTCLEIYLGDQVEDPAYAMHNGKIIALDVPADPGSVLQIFGDDGPVFIAVDGVTHCNRISDCGLPEIPTADLEEIVNSIVGR